MGYFLYILFGISPVLLFLVPELGISWIWAYAVIGIIFGLMGPSTGKPHYVIPIAIMWPIFWVVMIVMSIIVLSGHGDKFS